MGRTDMSREQRVVAEAAIRPYKAEHYLDLHSQIAARTGCPLKQVEEIIHALIVDDSLRARTEPMLNLRPHPILEPWYEKGDGWVSQPNWPHEPESAEPDDHNESGKREELEKTHRLRDQIRGETTEHASPPRLEDEGQSGG
jgi:hypothetical protein